MSQKLEFCSKDKSGKNPRSKLQQTLRPKVNGHRVITHTYRDTDVHNIYIYIQGFKVKWAEREQRVGLGHAFAKATNRKECLAPCLYPCTN